MSLLWICKSRFDGSPESLKTDGPKVVEEGDELFEALRSHRIEPSRAFASLA
jgi:hypothetical protein